MADNHFEIEIHEEGAIRWLREREILLRRRLRGVVEETSEHAATWLRIYVPKWTQYTLRHIDQTGAHWRPGGAGGGGEWVAVAGVKRGESIHPIYAVKGTGIYVGRGLIVPRGLPRADVAPGGDAWGAWRSSMQGGSDRRKLVYRVRSGRLMRTPFVRGQQPKPFLYQTFLQTRLYAQARIHTFGMAV